MDNNKQEIGFELFNQQQSGSSSKVLMMSRDELVALNETLFPEIKSSKSEELTIHSAASIVSRTDFFHTPTLDDANSQSLISPSYQAKSYIYQVFSIVIICSKSRSLIQCRLIIFI